VIADLPNHDDPWEKVGRWFVADPEARSVAPFSDVKVSAYVKRRIEGGMVDGLQDALLASPENPIVRARCGLQSLAPDKSPGDESNIKADQETLLATLLAPDNAEVWRARVCVLEALKRPEEARAAKQKLPR
jgi:hypothetical protein